MKTKNVVGGSSITATQMKDFWRQVDDGSITKESLQAFLEHRSPSMEESGPEPGRVLFRPCSERSTEEQLAEWVQLYAPAGIRLDPAEVKVSPRQESFSRLIVIPEGMTAEKVYYDLCKEKFPCWKYANGLDEAVSKNERDTSATYAVWVRDRVEADEELKNLSADMLEERGIKGITLTERLLLEYKYFAENGRHLDVVKRTLCSGSRSSGGGVPYMGWSDGRLEVFWCLSRRADGDLCARAVPFKLAPRLCRAGLFPYRPATTVAGRFSCTISLAVKLVPP